MSTSFETIYTPFFKRIEKDPDFFEYNNVLPTDALALAYEQAQNYLIESITKLTLMCTLDINIKDYSIEDKIINIDLTTTEIDILAQLMFEQYLGRDFATLKTFQTRFSPSDLKVFSPAEERRTFTDMFKFVQKQSEKMVDDYSSRDRITGKRKLINHSLYAD